MLIQIGSAKDEMAARIREENRDILRRGQVNERCDNEGQGADNHCGCLCLHRRACTFAFIFRRSRSTLARLFKASKDCHPPALNGDDDGEEVHFRQRHVSIMREQASGILSPTCCASMTRRNSLLTGSCHRCNKTHGIVQWQAGAMERTITSSALGSSSRNLFWRRLMRKPIRPRGIPTPRR